MEIIGWSANIVFVLAYLLVSSGKLKGESITFNMMNLVGALLYGIYAVGNHAQSLLVLEIFWASVAVVAIRRALKKSSV
jgi:hypothetical protein